MGREELRTINRAKEIFGKDIVDEALIITTQDIKGNNIALNKFTNRKRFMEIFFGSIELLMTERRISSGIIA